MSDNADDDAGLSLTDDEVKAIIMSFAHARGDKGFTETEVQVIVDWAIETQIRMAMLSSILEGELLVDLIGGDDVAVRPPDANYKPYKKKDEDKEEA